MITIYECIDGGTDGMDSSTIGYTTNSKLARELVLGRGTMGAGNGTIREFHAWETRNDLPEEISQRMIEENNKLKDSIRTLSKKLGNELEYLPSNADRILAIEGILEFLKEHTGLEVELKKR